MPLGGGMGVICACEQRNDDLSVVKNEIESNRTRLLNETQKTSNQKDEGQGRRAMKRMIPIIKFCAG